MSATEAQEHVPFIDYENLPAPTEGLSGVGGPPGLMSTHELASLTMQGFSSNTTWPPRTSE